MISPLTLSQIATITQGELFSAQVDELQVTAVSKDTRTLQRGDLYVALTGGNFEGHQFVAAAQQAGASAALVEHVDTSSSLVQIQVANTLNALVDLARHNREQFVGPVVAITGSAGKTSTKQLTHAVLSQQYHCLMTAGNLNNHIGVPLTLLELTAQHQAAVIELGASAVGEIAANASWVQPQVAIITNAVAAHLEGFGSLENIVRTKGELLDHIQAGGSAILNADDPHYADWVARAQQADANVLSFGFAEQADVRASKVTSSLLGSTFELSYQGQTATVNLPLLGEHNVANALAAAAAGFALGLDFSAVVQGLESVTVVAGRLQSLQGHLGQTLLNDAYNANPTSVKAAIDVLTKAKNNWLVLGDMAELGSDEVQQHQQVGVYAKQQGVQHLLATGKLSKHTVDAFGEGAHWYATREEIAQFLQQHTQQDDVILVKGSRSAGMEKIIEQLQHDTKVS